MSDPRKENGVAKFLFVMGTVISVLGLAECAARVWYNPIRFIDWLERDEHVVLSSAERRAICDVFEYHPVHFWELRPNLQNNLSLPPGWVDTWTNRYGLRCPNFSVRKPQGEYRILLLGSSDVYGFGIPYDKTFGFLLQAALRRRLSHQTPVVINAGVPGYSSFQCLSFMTEHALAWSPDLVIIGDDFASIDTRLRKTSKQQRGAIGDGYPSVSQLLVAASRLLQWFQYLNMRFAGRRASQGSLPGIAPREGRRYISQMVYLARVRLHAKVVLIEFPDRSTYKETFRILTHHPGVYCLDLSRYHGEVLPTYTYTEEHIPHYSSMTHQEIADRLTAFLREHVLSL